MQRPLLVRAHVEAAWCPLASPEMWFVNMQVGKGHLRGVCYHLQGDSSALRFKDLVGNKNERGRRRVDAAQQLARQAALDLASAGVLLWAWSVWGPQL